jgi:hypothetical protein
MLSVPHYQIPALTFLSPSHIQPVQRQKPESQLFRPASLHRRGNDEILRRIWRSHSRVVCWKSIDVSEEHVALLATCFHAGFLLGLFFEPENGGDMFLWNVSWLLRDYTALYHRRQNSSQRDPAPSLSNEIFNNKQAYNEYNNNHTLIKLFSMLSLFMS